MIQEAIAQRVLDAALETGGDFSELFMEDTETHSISMLNGTVENATYRRRTGAGVRVLKGEQSAYAYTADTSEAALLEAARGAAAALEGKKTLEAAVAATKRPAVYGPAIPFDTVDNQRRVQLLRQGTAAAQAQSGEIARVVAGYGLSLIHI